MKKGFTLIEVIVGTFSLAIIMLVSLLLIVVLNNNVKEVSTSNNNLTEIYQFDMLFDQLFEQNINELFSISNNKLYINDNLVFEKENNDNSYNYKFIINNQPKTITSKINIDVKQINSNLILIERNINNMRLNRYLFIRNTCI